MSISSMIKKSPLQVVQNDVNAEKKDAFISITARKDGEYFLKVERDSREINSGFSISTKIDKKVSDFIDTNPIKNKSKAINALCLYAIKKMEESGEKVDWS